MPEIEKNTKYHPKKVQKKLKFGREKIAKMQKIAQKRKKPLNTRMKKIYISNL